MDTLPKNDNESSEAVHKLSVLWWKLNRKGQRCHCHWRLSYCLCGTHSMQRRSVGMKVAVEWTRNGYGCRCERIFRKIQRIVDGVIELIALTKKGLRRCFEFEFWLCEISSVQGERPLATNTWNTLIHSVIDCWPTLLLIITQHSKGAVISWTKNTLSHSNTHQSFQTTVSLADREKANEKRTSFTVKFAPARFCQRKALVASFQEWICQDLSISFSYCKSIMPSTTATIAVPASSLAISAGAEDRHVNSSTSNTSLSKVMQPFKFSQICC